MTVDFQGYTAEHGSSHHGRRDTKEMGGWWVRRWAPRLQTDDLSHGRLRVPLSLDTYGTPWAASTPI